jgi:hypothetical protein
VERKGRLRINHFVKNIFIIEGSDNPKGQQQHRTQKRKCQDFFVRQKNRDKLEQKIFFFVGFFEVNVWFKEDGVTGPGRKKMGITVKLFSIFSIWIKN